MSYNPVLDWYDSRLKVLTESVSDVGDGIAEVSVKNYGTPLQRISDRLLRDDIARLMVLRWMRRLNRRDYTNQTEWYIRRGWRFWPLEVAYRLSCAYEWCQWRMLFFAYHRFPKNRLPTDAQGRVLTWKLLLRCSIRRKP